MAAITAAKNADNKPANRRRRSPERSREGRRRKKPATKRKGEAKREATGEPKARPWVNQGEARSGAKPGKSGAKSETNPSPVTTLRHEPAAAERRRARPVEGRHPFGRAAAEGAAGRAGRRRARGDPDRAEVPAKPAPPLAAPVPPAKPAQPPPLAPLGRKTKKRIARGSHAIDGRLDLHGLTQARGA